VRSLCVASPPSPPSAQHPLACWAHGPLSREPPPGHKRFRGAGIYRAYPCYGDCPLCLLGNSKAMPSYRRSIRWAVGDLPPRSGSEGGGGGHSGTAWFWFVLCLCCCLRPTSLLASWPMGPCAVSPLQVTKSSGGPVSVPCVPMLQGLPPLPSWQLAGCAVL
jgi:hypothetical protein